MLGPFIVCGIGMSLFFALVAIVILGAVGIEQEGAASAPTTRSASSAACSVSRS